VMCEVLEATLVAREKRCEWVGGKSEIGEGVCAPWE